jgi:WD40 repeat protein
MKLTLDLDVKLPAGALGLAIVPNGDTAFAACADGAIRCVDLNEGEIYTFSERHSSFASACVLLPDGRTLISGGYDGMLLWHDVQTGKCLRRVAAHKFWNWQIALSRDGQRLATTTGQYVPGGWKYEPAPETEPSVKVFDTATGNRIAAFSHVPPVMSCAFSPDGQHLAAGNLICSRRLAARRWLNGLRRILRRGAPSNRIIIAAVSTVWPLRSTEIHSWDAAWGL